MKIKLATLILAAVASLGSAHAAVIGLTGIANTTVGLVTHNVSATTSTGTAYFFSSAVDLAPGDLAGLVEAEGAAAKLAFFTGKLGSDPGLVRGSVAYTNGAMTSSGNVEMGAAGNNTYLLFISSDGLWVGAFQNIDAPSVGTIVMNPASMTEDLVGTSTLTNVSGTNSGFALVTVVPEPSIALLGALGVFGLIRRRR